MLLAEEFLAISSSAVKIASERRCAILVHSVSEPFFGKGMRRSTFQWKKGFSVERGEAIQWMRGLVTISTGKAIQWRGWGHSLNRRTPKIEKLLSSSPSRKSALSIYNGLSSYQILNWLAKIAISVTAPEFFQNSYCKKLWNFMFG